eukprot:s2653_g5.t1
MPALSSYCASAHLDLWRMPRRLQAAASIRASNCGQVALLLCGHQSVWTGSLSLTGPQLLRVQESKLMLERCVSLSTRHLFRGHGHLEQPPSAMSWQEPVQQYIAQEACACIS